MKDPNGELGVLALCSIGAVAGGLVNYASQVILNYRGGATGSDIWLDVNWGAVAGATFSGAVSAIPGGGLAAEAADIIGSTVIEHAFNAYIMKETEFNIKAVGEEILSEAITSLATSKVSPDLEIPKYIRDIKEEARDAGIKGTRKLQRYLNLKQTANIITNTFNSSTVNILAEFN